MSQNRHFAIFQTRALQQTNLARRTCNNKIRRDKLRVATKQLKLGTTTKLSETNSRVATNKFGKTKLLQEQISARRTHTSQKTNLLRRTTTAKFGETKSPFRKEI